MAVKKSIAIIGEGETEWWYFDTLRIACRYKFKVAPDFPQHSDIPHMAKLAEEYVKRDTDYVVCLVDMDRLLKVPAEIYEDVLPDLQRYMPGYEKTARYFKKNNLYKYLTENGDLERAIGYAEELSRLSEASTEDKIAYSQMHLVFELIKSMNEEEADKNEQKTEIGNRNEENRRQIIDFVADNEISDSKSISKAIGLKPSRTRDYLKQLVDDGVLEIEGEYKNRKYKIKK